MIIALINKMQFEYDIHSLIKAFYPEENVKVLQVGGEVIPSDMQIHIRFSPQEIIVTAEDGMTGQTKDNRTTADGETVSHVAENHTTVVRVVSLTGAEERPELKNRLKQTLYAVLSELTGKELPWGTLTGIRPTKIAMGMLEAGRKPEEILQSMQAAYLVSDDKGRLSIQIAEREKQLLSQLHDQNGYSLYIGIPFCPTTCLYCSFTSYPICTWRNRIGDYLKALEKEMAFVAKAYRDKVLDTVYIGGGTPTTLEAEELHRLLAGIRDTFCFDEVKEFTVEAGRADSITRAKLEVLKKHGVGRISVNPQTMKEETLRIIGRQHTVGQVRDAFALAREVGFININMDLILGLPGETADDVSHTMEEIMKLEPDSLTVHSLAIKRASKLHEWVETHGIEALQNTDETMALAAQAAVQMQMKPYYLYRQKNMSGNFENIGYAREGKEGLYNILIMEEKQTIAALGAGSISKVVLADRIERTDNVKDAALYIERIDEMIERKKKLFSMEKEIKNGIE